MNDRHGFTAKSRGSHHSILIERPIDEYLRNDPFSLAHALERLRRAIHNEEAQCRTQRTGAGASCLIQFLPYKLSDVSFGR